MDEQTKGKVVEERSKGESLKKAIATAMGLEKGCKPLKKSTDVLLTVPLNKAWSESARTAAAEARRAKSKREFQDHQDKTTHGGGSGKSTDNAQLSLPLTTDPDTDESLYKERPSRASVAANEKVAAKLAGPLGNQQSTKAVVSAAQRDNWQIYSISGYNGRDVMMGPKGSEDRFLVVSDKGKDLAMAVEGVGFVTIPKGIGLNEAVKAAKQVAKDNPFTSFGEFSERSAKIKEGLKAKGLGS